MTTPFPDLEKGLVLWARSQTDLVGASDTTTPTATTGWPATLAYVRPVVLGGPGDGVTTAAVVELDVFSRTRNKARDTCAELVERLAPRVRVGSAMIDHVTTRVSPRQLPWDNTEIKRFTATLVITTRR